MAWNSVLGGLLNFDGWRPYLRGSKVLANRARAALREQRSSKLGVSSFLDFQKAWYALFEALNGLEQLAARSSSEFLGAPHSE